MRRKGIRKEWWQGKKRKGALGEELYHAFKGRKMIRKDRRKRENGTAF